MARRRIHPSELKIGRPLPCDAYDSKGMLLLRKGQVITSAAQIERLVRNSLQVQVPDRGAPEVRTQVSPLSLVLAAQQQLHALFAAPPAPGFPVELLRIAGMLRRACKANADVALASILMCRDGPYASRHAVNVAIASCIAGTAMQLGVAELNTIVAAALTMNIGMFELQGQLHALDGSLTGEQRMEVRSHCERGVALLRQRGVTGMHWLNIVRDHHERLDGGGYPSGKAGDAIGLTTRLVALGDVYCARVSSREHRPAMRPNVALRWLFLNEGVVVDEHLAVLFIKTLGIYPPGTGVRLHNGSIAVVTHCGTTGCAPTVASITTQDGLRTGMPIRRRGNEQRYAVSEVVDLDALGLTVDMEALWGADAMP